MLPDIWGKQYCKRDNILKRIKPKKQKERKQQERLDRIKALNKDEIVEYNVVSLSQLSYPNLTVEPVSFV